MIPRLKAVKKLCKNGPKTHMENLTASTQAEMQPPCGFSPPSAARIPTKRAVTLSGNVASPGVAQC